MKSKKELRPSMANIFVGLSAIPLFPRTEINKFYENSDSCAEVFAGTAARLPLRAQAARGLRSYPSEKTSPFAWSHSS